MVLVAEVSCIGYDGMNERILDTRSDTMIDPAVERGALRRFRAKRIMTVIELAGLLRCSIPTVRKRLRSWDTFTSYNRNGSYYSLPEVPRFDELGLWKYKGVFFSRHGTFASTVQYLVQQAERGLDAVEIGRLVGVPVRSFISRLPLMPEVVREKREGRFVYFSVEPERGDRQKQLREESGGMRAVQLPADTEAIAILVDRMKHPDSSDERTAHRLRRRGVVVSVEAIEDLLAYHGVEKKTADTR